MATKKQMAKPTSLTTSKTIKLTKSNYYSHDTDFQYMSFSVFKDFEKCEAATLAKLKGDWEPSSDPKALLIGNYVHSYFESPEAHQEFVEANKSEILSSRGKTKGQLKSDYKAADDMIKALSEDDFFNYVYAPGKKEVIVTGELFGHQWKGKIDSLCLDRGYFCDLKTVDDFHKGHWNPVLRQKTNFVEDRGYHMQMAIYQKLIKQTFGIDCQPYIFGVSKQPIPDKIAISFDGDGQFLMQSALEKIKTDQDRFWRVLMGEEKPKRCSKCEYCRQSKQLAGFTEVSQIEIS
ncbi:PD-(D/E)XK nuclease-like domain-containing protein [Limosilactobacillus mucosae]|uniref:PD-(D/E)XK nuclease-like domain-containing protein n=1 Tax=Limosilactobacillus mucosae TaxID=97478 RepID=UPI003C6CF9CF